LKVNVVFPSNNEHTLFKGRRYKGELSKKSCERVSTSRLGEHFWTHKLFDKEKRKKMR